MGKVITGARGITRERAQAFTYKQKTLVLFEQLREDKDMTSVERNDDTGAVRATAKGHNKTDPDENVILNYKLGEDTKGFTKLSCGTENKSVKTEKGWGIVTYTGKQLEVRCQDVLFHKGCVCVLKPEGKKDPETKKQKHSVDCFFMKKGMDEPVKADIKSPSPNYEEKRNDCKVTSKHIGNVIGHGLKQAKGDDADHMILYFDKADYYDDEAVRDGINMYATNDNIENKQIKNLIIVVNDDRPVDIISI